MKKSKFVSVIGMAILGFLVIGLLVLSIRNLSGAGTYMEKDVVQAVEAFRVKNSYAFIPIATEHYYYGLTTDDEILIIKADAKWYDKNFDYSGYAKNGDYVSVKGTKSHLSTEAKKGITTIAGLSFVDKNSSANALYKKQSVQCIVLVVVGVALGIFGVVLGRAGMTNVGSNKNVIGTVFSIVVIVFIVFALRALVVMF